MGLLDNESIPRRKMILFFVIDTSGSMLGSKIGSVNDAIENVLPMIGEISDENPDAEINVAALEFSTGTRQGVHLAESGGRRPYLSWRGLP